jgi:hypothetical protein
MILKRIEQDRDGIVLEDVLPPGEMAANRLRTMVVARKGKDDGRRRSPQPDISLFSRRMAILRRALDEAGNVRQLRSKLRARLHVFGRSEVRDANGGPQQGHFCRERVLLLGWVSGQHRRVLTVLRTARERAEEPKCA